MEPSDWVAVGALCISGIALFTSVLVSIAGFWFNYRTNKENNTARRADIVTEKSIEAYRDIVEKMITFRNKILLRDPKLVEAGNEFFAVYVRDRVYIARTLVDDLDEIWQVLSGFYRKLGHDWSEEEINSLTNAVEKFDTLIDRIQIYLGLEPEKTP